MSTFQRLLEVKALNATQFCILLSLVNLKTISFHFLKVTFRLIIFEHLCT